MGPIKRPIGKNPFKSQETLGNLQSSEPSLLTSQGKNHSMVKKACFGLHLDPDFEEIIDGFKDSLESLREMHDISVTPKFHMICIEVKRICKMTGESLKFNEQSLESSHKKFKQLLLRFAGLDPDTDNPLWPLHVLRALEVFNSNATFRDSL